MVGRRGQGTREKEIGPDSLPDDQATFFGKWCCIVHNWTSKALLKPSGLSLCSPLAHRGVLLTAVGLPILVFRMENFPTSLLCLTVTGHSQAAAWDRGSIRQHIGLLVGSARVHDTRVT